jgi:anti-anti-sigma regulatory factor
VLKVSIREDSAGVVMEVEGRVAGAWVEELQQCWQREQARAGGPISVHLSAVTFIDDAGKQLLSRMFQHGVKLQGKGCMVRAIVAEITSRAEGKWYAAPESPNERGETAEPLTENNGKAEST